MILKDIRSALNRIADALEEIAMDGKPARPANVALNPILSPKQRPAAQRKNAWTSQEDQILINARLRGATFESIAKALPGRTTGACQSRYVLLRERRDKNDTLL